MGRAVFMIDGETFDFQSEFEEYREEEPPDQEIEEQDHVQLIQELPGEL